MSKVWEWLQRSELWLLVVIALLLILMVINIAVADRLLIGLAIYCSYNFGKLWLKLKYPKP